MNQILNLTPVEARQVDEAISNALMRIRTSRQSLSNEANEKAPRVPYQIVVDTVPDEPKPDKKGGKKNAAPLGTDGKPMTEVAE